MMTTKKSKGKWLMNAAYQYGFQLTVGSVPRVIYGNDAGMFNNIRANRELRSFQAVSAASLDSTRDSRAEMLRAQGFLPIEAGYDKGLMNTIVKRYRAAIEDPRDSKAIGPRIKDAARGIVDPVQAIPEITELLNDDIQAIFRGYYRSHIQVKHVRAWRIVNVPQDKAGTDVYSNLWHNDPHPVTLMRYFVYLTDGVSRDTGATHVHPIPSTKQIIRAGYLRRRAIVGPAKRMIEDRSRMAFFEGNVGSGFMLNPQLCLHRAGVPKPGAIRDMVQFTVAPSDRPLARDWPAHLEPDPEAVA